jgi:hypothetical protein
VCPECSTKHPLGDIGDRTAFPCTGCGRQLKVPAAAVTKQTVPPSPAPLPAEPRRRAGPREPEPEPEHETRMMPVAASVPPPPVVVTPPPPPAPEPKPPRPYIPPVWVRFLLWIVAIPLAFLVVFAVARGLGMLSSNQIQDLAIAEGVGRFWPIARLIPFIAFAAALFVQGSTYGIARLRERRAAEAAKAKAKPGGKRPGGPTSNGSGSRPAKRPAQSSRPRA